MWSSGVISTPTARIIASEIWKKKNLAYHVMSLRMSMVSKDVLKHSDLLEALESHTTHPGIGLSIRELLDRLLNISEGKEDRINQLFEAKNGISPFRQPKTRSRTSGVRIKIRFGQEEKEEPNGSEDSEEAESDYSDTDSETEWPLQRSLLEAKRQEEEETLESKIEEDQEIDEKPTISTENETIRKRKWEEIEEEITVKIPKMELPSPQKSADSSPTLVPRDEEPAKNEKELNLAVKELLHLIKRDLNGKSMEQEVKKTKIPEKKAEKRAILIDVLPQTLKKVKKERKEEKKEKRLKKTDFKEEKPFSKKLLAERSGNIQNSTENRPEITVKHQKIEELKQEIDPVKELAEKLNGLPLVPSRDQVLPLVTNLTPTLLTAAEKLIGRNMRRVDWLWWELMLRDFGQIDRANCAGDVRDIYAAKKLFAERKKKREMKEST